MLIRCHGGTRFEHTKHKDKEERGRKGKLHRVDLADVFGLGKIVCTMLTESV